MHQFTDIGPCLEISLLNDQDVASWVAGMAAHSFSMTSLGDEEDGSEHDVGDVSAATEAIVRIAHDRPPALGAARRTTSMGG